VELHVFAWAGDSKIVEIIVDLDAAKFARFKARPINELINYFEPKGEILCHSF